MIYRDGRESLFVAVVVHIATSAQDESPYLVESIIGFFKEHCKSQQSPLTSGIPISP